MHVALYARVSTADKHPQAGTRNPETQLRPLRDHPTAMPDTPTASAFVNHASWGVTVARSAATSSCAAWSSTVRPRKQRCTVLLSWSGDKVARARAK